MHGRLFTLVTGEDSNQIFAWGIEIIDQDYVEAVTYRRELDTQASFGRYDSAEAARRLFSLALRREFPEGLTLVWEDPGDQAPRLATPEPEPVPV